jgi:putative ABC transport system permease protein
LLWGGALLVLLIGCMNVASLALVHSRARLRELATRIALGASRWRIVRQLVTEHVLLTMVSAGGGLLIGYAALRLLGTMNVDQLPGGAQALEMEAVTGACALSVAAAIGIVLGGIPIIGGLPADVTAILRSEGRAGTSGRGVRAMRRA